MYRTGNKFIIISNGNPTHYFDKGAIVEYVNNYSKDTVLLKGPKGEELKKVYGKKQYANLSNTIHQEVNIKCIKIINKKIKLYLL